MSRVVIAALAGVSLSACTEPPIASSTPVPTSTQATAAPTDRREPWLDRSLCAQVDAMQAGTLRSEDLVLGYLDRIDVLDRGNDGLYAVLGCIDDAAVRAAELDAKPERSHRLHGAVLLVKDNIDVRGLATTAGSLAMIDNVPDADAPLVAKLRDAGALVLGKANLSEWANIRGHGSTSGWSSVGGQTRNGFDPEHSPCGSSSGSAAAVAAGLASAAIGTETDGSIVCPASMNGVVGFKPTVGLVSRTGIVPISHSQDTAGPMTRTVADAARLLGVMAGRDPGDPATAAIPEGMSFDFETPLLAASLSGARLGVVTELIDEPELAPLMARTRARLEAAGAVLVDVELPTYDAFGDDELLVLTTELATDIDVYLRSHARAGQPASLAELVTFDRAHADEVMPFFGQEVFEAALQVGGLDDPRYRAALARSRTAIGEQGIARVLARERLDALISPTASPPWRLELGVPDPPASVASSPAAVAGYPHLTVPMGTVDGLPVGLSFFAAAWQDAQVLALGHAFEQLPD